MARKNLRAEEVINEVRKTQKDTRRAYYRLVRIGLVNPGDATARSFSAFDLALYELVDKLLNAHFGMSQLALFDENEEDQN